MSQLPKQPPCIPYEGGKSGIRKSGEAIAKCVEVSVLDEPKGSVVPQNL